MRIIKATLQRNTHHTNFLKIQLIDTIENIDPPEDCTDIKAWTNEKLEQLEEYYRTLLCSYVPHGLNVRGESKYSKWQKLSTNNSSSVSPHWLQKTIYQLSTSLDIK